MELYSHIGLVTIVVNNYDEAINYYTNTLGFQLVENTNLTALKRWVIVSPSHQSNCNLLLAKAKNDNELAAIGNQTGGRVGFFLYTKNIEYTFNSLTKKGVQFIEPIRTESYGKVVVFKDIYGNLWDLIELTN